MKLLPHLYSNLLWARYRNMPSRAQLLLREYLISEVEELSADAFENLAKEIAEEVDARPADYEMWFASFCNDFQALFDRVAKAVNPKAGLFLVKQLCRDVARMEERILAGTGSELSCEEAERSPVKDKCVLEDETDWKEFLDELEEVDNLFVEDDGWGNNFLEEDDDWGDIFPEEDNGWDEESTGCRDDIPSEKEDLFAKEMGDIWEELFAEE